jgi:hypothetical protein
VFLNIYFIHLLKTFSVKSVLPFVLKSDSAIKRLMKTDNKTHGKRMTSKLRVDLFFSRIIECQRLEEEYYQTGNQALLVDID